MPFEALQPAMCSVASSLLARAFADEFDMPTRPFRFALQTCSGTDSLATLLRTAAGLDSQATVVFLDGCNA